VVPAASLRMAGGPARMSRERDFRRGADKVTNMWYTYILYDRVRKIFYVGFTSDLKRRLSEHMAGSNHTTKRMEDIELVYYEACRNETDARAREKSLKTGFGRQYIKNRLKNYFNH
jgi:putative endonuclease